MGALRTTISVPFRAIRASPSIRIFTLTLLPGWFDKPFARRRLAPTSVDHMLLLAPSPAFVAGLPGGKIPDRKDPQALGGAALGARWGQVAEASRALGDAWAALTEGEGLGLARALAS
jgi:hypothetical protein